MTRMLEFIEKLLLHITSAMFFFIVILTLVQVFYRYVLNDALSWSSELTRIVFVWMTFLGSAVAINRGRHMRIDTVVGLLPARIQVMVDIAVHVAMVVFLVVVSYLSLEIIERSATAVTGALRWPRSVFFIPLLAGGSLMTVYCLRRIVLQCQALAKGWEV